MNEQIYPGTISMPCEIYQTADAKKTFMVLRGGVCQGKMFQFGQAMNKFCEDSKFSNIAILTSTVSIVKRHRESNRDLPEIFAYVNNFLHKKCCDEGKDYYEKYGI